MTDVNSQKATVEFKDLEMANKFRHELNLKKLKNKNIRIMSEKKIF